MIGDKVIYHEMEAVIIYELPVYNEALIAVKTGDVENYSGFMTVEAVADVLPELDTKYKTEEFKANHMCLIVSVDTLYLMPDKYYDEHYHECVLEPIKVMEKMFTKEELMGFIKGCIVKYRLRLGHKSGEDTEKELLKIKRYEQWLQQVKEGKVIDVN